MSRLPVLHWEFYLLSTLFRQSVIIQRLRSELWTEHLRMMNCSVEIVGYGLSNVVGALLGGLPHSNIQPERWYCYNYKGYQPLGTGTCSCNSRYSRSGSEILSYPDNDSSVCTGWCNCVCICIDRNDRYEAGCFC